MSSNPGDTPHPDNGTVAGHRSEQTGTAGHAEADVAPETDVLDQEEVLDGAGAYWTPTEPPLISYLKSPQGHEVVQKVIEFFGEIKAATLDTSRADKVSKREHKRSRERWLLGMQFSVFAVSVVAVTWLAAIDRFEPAVATLIGTIVGYFFGKGARR
jgi:hypothetical protein